MKRILWTVGTSALLGGIGLWCAAEPAPAPENDASSRSLEGATLDLRHQYSGTWQMIDNGFALEDEHQPVRYGVLLQLGTYEDSDHEHLAERTSEQDGGEDTTMLEFSFIEVHGTHEGRPRVWTLGSDAFKWIDAWEAGSKSPIEPEEARRLGPFVTYAKRAWDADRVLIDSRDLRRRSLHGSLEVAHLLTCWFADRSADIQVLEQAYGDGSEGVRYLFRFENALKVMSYRATSDGHLVWDGQDYGLVSDIVVMPPFIDDVKFHGGLHDPPPGGGSTGGG